MRCHNAGLGSSPFARHYLGNHYLFSLPRGTKMFQFPRLASCIRRMAVLQTAGLSHSEIPGSKVICTYPRLIAAYHVLLRLHEPRHPPCALSYFLYDCCVFLLVVGCWLSVCYLLPSSSSFTFTTTAHTFSCIFVKSSSFGKLIHSSWNLSFTYLQFCLVSICQRSLGNEELRMKNEEYELLFSLNFFFSVPSSFPEWRITDSNRWPPACKAGALANWANPPGIWCNS